MENGPVINDLPMYIYLYIYLCVYVCMYIYIYIYTLETSNIFHTVAVAMLRG